MHPFGQGCEPSCVRKHELQNCVPCHGQGFLQQSPTSPCTPKFRRDTPPQRRPRCLPTLRVPGAFDQACDLVLKSRPNPTRGRSTPTRPSTERRQRIPLSRRRFFPRPQRCRGSRRMTAFAASSRCRRTRVSSSPPLLSTGSTVDSLRRKRPAVHVFRPLAARQRSRRVASNMPQIWTRSAF